MKMAGLTLTEALVSLLLIASVSVGLLRQQWQCGVRFTQLYDQSIVQLCFENQKEHEHHA